MHCLSNFLPWIPFTKAPIFQPANYIERSLAVIIWTVFLRVAKNISDECRHLIVVCLIIDERILQPSIMSTDAQATCPNKMFLALPQWIE
jgi:hypothetical protein